MPLEVAREESTDRLLDGKVIVIRPKGANRDASSTVYVASAEAMIGETFEHHRPHGEVYEGITCTTIFCVSSSLLMVL